jgi:tyrosine-protein kinase Etk/Wzc
MSIPSSEVQHDSDEISLLDLLQVVAENLRLLIFMPLLVGLIALGITFLVPPTFTATTVFLPPQQQQSAAAALLQSLGALGGLAGAATGIKNPNDQFVAFVNSRAVQDRLIDRFKLKDRYEAEFQEDARESLGEVASVSAGKDGLIAVQVEDKDPHFAAQLANAHVEELGKLMERLAVTEAQQRRKFFETQLLVTKENLTKAEQALRASGVNSSALKSNPAAAVEVVARVQAEIAAQEVKLQSMRSYLAETAPLFKQALNELGALRAQLAKVERSGDLDGTGSDYIARFRDFKYHETLFELFAKQFELAKVDEAREGAVIQVVDKAMPAEKKSKPKRAVIAVLATLATGFALLLLVFVRQTMRTAGYDPEVASKLRAIQDAVSFRRLFGRGGNGA